MGLKFQVGDKVRWNNPIYASLDIQGEVIKLENHKGNIYVSWSNGTFSYVEVTNCILISKKSNKPSWM